MVIIVALDKEVKLELSVVVLLLILLLFSCFRGHTQNDSRGFRFVWWISQV
jgi:hypothetical protein